MILNQPSQDASRTGTRPPKALFAAVFLCLVGAIGGGVVLGPAYRKMYEDLGVTIDRWCSVGLSPWWWAAWATVLVVAIIVATVAKSDRVRTVFLASALSASVGGSIYFLLAVALVEMPMMAIKN